MLELLKLVNWTFKHLTSIQLKWSGRKQEFQTLKCYDVQGKISIPLRLRSMILTCLNWFQWREFFTTTENNRNLFSFCLQWCSNVFKVNLKEFIKTSGFPDAPRILSLYQSPQGKRLFPKTKNWMMFYSFVTTMTLWF